MCMGIILFFLEAMILVFLYDFCNACDSKYYERKAIPGMYLILSIAALVWIVSCWLYFMVDDIDYSYTGFYLVQVFYNIFMVGSLIYLHKRLRKMNFLSLVQLQFADMALKAATFMQVLVAFVTLGLIFAEY